MDSTEALEPPKDEPDAVFDVDAWIDAIPDDGPLGAQLDVARTIGDALHGVDVSGLPFSVEWMTAMEPIGAVTSAHVNEAVRGVGKDMWRGVDTPVFHEALRIGMQPSPTNALFAKIGAGMAAAAAEALAGMRVQDQFNMKMFNAAQNIVAGTFIRSTNAAKYTPEPVTDADIVEHQARAAEEELELILALPGYEVEQLAISLGLAVDRLPRRTAVVVVMTLLFVIQCVHPKLFDSLMDRGDAWQKLWDGAKEQWD